MTRWSDASGFFLLETMGVAAVLIVMAGALMLFRQGVLMEEQTRFEAAATCLAESELAHIEYRAAAGTLTEGASERREYVVFSPAAIGSATEDETGGDFLLRTDIQRMEQEHLSRCRDRRMADARRATAQTVVSEEGRSV